MSINPLYPEGVKNQRHPRPLKRALHYIQCSTASNPMSINWGIDIGVKIIEAKQEVLIYVTNSGVHSERAPTASENIKKRVAKKAPLMLIKSIAKQHGGQLVISDNIGKGCLTYPYLPHRTLNYR